MRLLISSAALLLFLCASHAIAQDTCPPDGVRGPVEVTPASGAGGVRLDAPVRVRFTDGFFAGEGAPDPQASLSLVDEAFNPVAGRVQLAGDDVLFFIPDQRWQPGRQYAGTAIGEVDLSFVFTAGNDVDRQPPFLPDIREVLSTRIEPRCDAPDGGYRVEIVFGVATDDGAAGSIEYTLYVARGGNAPVLVDRVRNVSADPTAEATMAFVLPAEQVDEAICVQVQATDGVGNVATNALHCFDPLEGPHFNGLCTAAPPAPRGPVHLAWLLIPPLLLARRRHA